ncbi:P-loop NTPase fold protein [Magnetospirillum aberrantis]|uniref:KAP NTPase domain-containing protein n=1 Tax=Magnetospirillum aberrantis SpK TaxID=908842 RepID=A0A7C9QSQ8_9PROT|nr:P-loop NTPase fold protein [Magnetospirillum aberrantis]NFV79299.1 hypothetical protein [Magnetospirillum aberrantis SpK]
MGQPLLELVKSDGVFNFNSDAPPPSKPVTLDNSTLSGGDVLSGKSNVPPPPPKSPAEALTNACDAIAPPASRGLRYLLRAAAFLGDQKSANAGIVSPATLLFTIADVVEQGVALGEDSGERRVLTVLAEAVMAADSYGTARGNYAPRVRLPGIKTQRFTLRRFQLSSAARRLLDATGANALRRGGPETTILDLIAAMLDTTSGKLAQLMASFHLDAAALRDALGLNAPAAPPPAAALVRTHPDAIGEVNEDLLDVSANVETFARFVAAQSTALPLAIGLFGDWGHGKSFFMKALKHRVETFAEQARKTETAGGQSPFLGHVAQIEFNAWHYIEADLWASLADHLFTRLNDHFRERSDDNVTDPLAELASAKAVLEESERQEQAAQRQFDAAQAQLQKTQAAYAKSLVARETQRIKWPQAGKVLARTALDTPELRKAWKDLGLPPEIESPDRLRECIDDLNQTAGTIRTTWTALTAGEGWNRPTLWLTLAVLALSCLVPALLRIPIGEGERNLLEVLFAAPAAWLFRLYQTAKSALEKLTAAKNSIADAVTTEQGKAVQALAEAEAAVTAKAGALELARAARSEAAEKLSTLRQQIKDSTPQERMRRFLEERVAAGTYAAKLGILATIRKDIEKLSDLLAPTDKAPDPDLPRLDRIILYIDDLDRCPAPLVVKVLQAIHLLLAFPLFVVVVAVDVRWLQASLKTAYSHLLIDGNDENSDDAAQASAVRPASTQDYLEKIFQVPYWVQPMDGTAASAYARRLMEQAAPPRPNESPQPDAAAATEAPTETGTDDQETPAETTIVSAPAAAQAEQQMEFARLEPREIDQIAELAPLLGGSPRRVKRFINLFSLIKVGLGTDELATLRQPGALEALLANLVVAAGAPRLAPAYFEALATTDSLATLISELDAKAKDDDSWHTVKRALIDIRLSPPALRDWARVAQRYSFTTEPPVTPPPSSPATA